MVDEIKRIDVAQAHEKLRGGNAVAIDVRMPFDFAGGRIPGSINLPKASLRFRKSELPQEAALLFFSEDGTDSLAACEIAASLGAKDVYNVEGGVSAWADGGYPLETISEGLASPPRVQHAG